jgi:hypothetical protein
MATIVDKTACESSGQGMEAGLLPINPFTALQFHFGMLLGVDDLETGQAYPRGKQRLHNAWLHGEGVVWGFNVAFNKSNELTVDPGLALDAAGHELHLDRQACLDLGQWYNAHQKDSGFGFKDQGGGKQFSVHLVAKFKACLTRPVPAILEPCAGTQTDKAYSRVFETVELLLRPGPATPKKLGYRRLRVLFELEEPDDAAQSWYGDVKARRETIQARPAYEQPALYLKALREFAAQDVIDLQPQQATATQAASMFPEDPTELVLANIENIVVKQNASGVWVFDAPDQASIDVTVRPSLIATSTIQELLCGPLFTAPAQALVGPTVIMATLAGKSISFTVSRPIAQATLDPKAFSVTDFSEAKGWTPLDIDSVTLQGDGSILIALNNAPAGTHVRLVILGTGPTPLLAADDLTPLGAPGAGGPDAGVDYVKMFTRS